MNDNMIGARALMVALEKEGVKEVFGLPGGANLPMYDELYKSNIRHILVRHEQDAAHMADGFGRVSRKPGVCFATSGPGATNLLTGIATAQADSAPMVAVTGQVPVAMIGKDAFQESDIIGMANPVVKYAFQPRTPGEVPEVVKKGFYIAETGRPGPVLIDVPKDVQQHESPMEFPEEFKIQGYHPWYEPDLAYKHFIPAKRLNIDFYFKNQQNLCGSLPIILIYYANVVSTDSFKGILIGIIYRDWYLHILAMFIQTCKVLVIIFILGFTCPTLLLLIIMSWSILIIVLLINNLIGKLLSWLLFLIVKLFPSFLTVNILFLVSKFNITFESGINVKLVTGNLFKKKIRLFKIYLNNGEIFSSNLVKHAIYINNSLIFQSKKTPLRLLLSKFYNSLNKGYNDDDFQNILISADSIKIFNNYY